MIKDKPHYYCDYCEKEIFKLTTYVESDTYYSTEIWNKGKCFTVSKAHYCHLDCLLNHISKTLRGEK